MVAHAALELFGHALPDLELGSVLRCIGLVHAHQLHELEVGAGVEARAAATCVHDLRDLVHRAICVVNLPGSAILTGTLAPSLICVSDSEMKVTNVGLIAGANQTNGRRPIPPPLLLQCSPVAAMDALIRWTALKDEARALTESIGRSGIEHHSLLKNAALLAAVRAQGIPAEHREWVWPLLLHAQVRVAGLCCVLCGLC